MKVKFKREGGFAGMALQREAEDSQLPDDARKALEALQIPKRRRKPARRDGFVYTVSFERNNQPVVVSLDEENVTNAVAPLIRYFEGQS